MPNNDDFDELRRRFHCVAHPQTVAVVELYLEGCGYAEISSLLNVPDTYPRQAMFAFLDYLKRHAT